MPRNKSPELLASRIVPTKLEHLNDVVVGTGELMKTISSICELCCHLWRRIRQVVML